jgi:hypothetical protein
VTRSSAILSTDVVDKPRRPVSSNTVQLKDTEDDTGNEHSATSTEYFLEAISETLENLSHIGIAIRKSSKSTETARARQYVSERTETQTFETLCFIALEALHPDAPESLHQQLCDSMVNRYARHLFRAPRQKILDQDTRQPSETPFVQHLDTLHAEGTAIVPVSVLEQPSCTIDRQDSTPLAIPLSSIDSSRFDHQLRSAQTPRSRSGTTVVLSKMHEPPIPDSEQTCCEWCFGKLDRRFVEGENWTDLGRYELLCS